MAASVSMVSTVYLKPLERGLASVNAKCALSSQRNSEGLDRPTGRLSLRSVLGKTKENAAHIHARDQLESCNLTQATTEVGRSNMPFVASFPQLKGPLL